MNNYNETTESFQIQRLPSWFRGMIGGQSNSFSNNFGSNYNTHFESNEQSFSFYRFGNWNSNSVSIRIQTSKPIHDNFGNYYNLGASIGNGGNYHFLKFTGGADCMDNYQVMASIPSRFQGHLGSFHAYGMTDNYLVFCEQPWSFDMNKMGSSSFSWDSMNFMQGEYNHFYVVDKRSGRRMEMNFVTDSPYFFYNFVNCYEMNGRMIIDAMGCDGSDFGMNCRSSRFIQERYSSSRVMRFELPLNGGYARELNWNGAMTRESSRMTLRPQYMFPESGMMNPCINPNYNFRRHQYTYGMSGNSLMKFDTFGGSSQAWRGNDYNCRSLKTMFVANPSGRCEDDGILISCMSDSQSRRSMVFIDPRNMEEMYRYPFDGSFGSNSPFARFFN